MLFKATLLPTQGCKHAAASMLRVCLKLLWDITLTQNKILFNLARIPILIYFPITLPSTATACRSLQGSPAPCSPCFSLPPLLAIWTTTHVRLSTWRHVPMQSCLCTGHQMSRTCHQWHIAYLALQAFHKHSREALPTSSQWPGSQLLRSAAWLHPPRLLLTSTSLSVFLVAVCCLMRVTEEELNTRGQHQSRVVYICSNVNTTRLTFTPNIYRYIQSAMEPGLY